MIPVQVEQLFLSNVGFVVLLRKKGDNHALPIFIGAAEAQAIALQLNKVEVPRPLTHDLLKNVLDFMEARVKRIEVCDLREGTFYARLVLERDGVEMPIDSRPSDAIALALRCGAAIFVEEKVMAEAARLITPPAEAVAAGAKSEPREARKLTPVEVLKQKLEAAVKEERYEEAAHFRDEIKRLETRHAGN